MSTARAAILRAKIEGILTDIMVKTNAANVYVDDTTTLAVKLAEIISDIGDRATSGDLSTAIANLRTELMGEGVPEAYDTFKELATYIETHQSAADALQAAIGNKADQSAVDAMREILDGLGSLAKLNEVGEDNLSAALKEKIDTAANGNHSHANKTVLDGITDEQVAAWNGKAKVYAAGETVDLADGEMFVQLV